MAQTPEVKVKIAVCKILDTLGAYYFKPPANGYGRQGIPDIVGCMNGKFFAIECKAGKGKTTALQDAELSRIHKAQGVAMVVNEHNLEDVMNMLELLAGTTMKGPELRAHLDDLIEARMGWSWKGEVQ
jgi:hypothetical protein